jgi:hypothetical protein
LELNIRIGQKFVLGKIMGRSAKRRTNKKSKKSSSFYEQGASVWTKRTVNKKTVEGYFSDPQLLDWIDSFWKGRTLDIDGNKHGAMSFVQGLRDRILQPGGFDCDHVIVVVTHTPTGDIEEEDYPCMGGINMATGVLWINPVFPGKPKLIGRSEGGSGVYKANDILPDFEKSLFRFIPA